MKKEIAFEVAPDKEFVLLTRKMELPDFVEAFVAPAVEQVRKGIREKKIKTVSRALDEFTEYVDDELTYFLQHNDQQTKDQILEWLLESVVGGYMNHFLKQAASKAFDMPDPETPPEE